MKNSKRCKKTTHKKVSLDFITSGIACNCLLALDTAGVLNKLATQKQISADELQKLPTYCIISSAVTTLIHCKILKKIKNSFKFTKFGVDLYQYIGLIKMLFDGYAKLMLHQNEIINNEITKPQDLIKGTSVSSAAVKLSSKFFDSILVQEIIKLQSTGGICDLGCGYGKMLAQLCILTGRPGLGFDSEQTVVKEAQNSFADSNISIQLGDIQNIKGVWDNITILLQCHVMHDIVPTSKCVQMMNSYLKNFPNMTHFLYIDTVAGYMNNSTDLLPGFDYVHGLLGIKTRNYQETIQMFKESDFHLEKEIPISGLPNTFLWLLIPNKQKI